MNNNTLDSISRETLKNWVNSGKELSLMENIFYFSRKLESEKKLFMMIWSITDPIGTFGPIRTLTQDQILSLAKMKIKITES